MIRLQVIPVWTSKLKNLNDIINNAKCSKKKISKIQFIELVNNEDL